MPEPGVVSIVLLAASGLIVQTAGLESAEGVVACALYDSAESFLGDSRVRAARLPIERLSAEWTIEDLAAGEYAVSCYHDRNGNGRLDRGAFGVPTEPYGFSNDARGSFGPPKYRKARFRFEGGTTTIGVSLR